MSYFDESGIIKLEADGAHPVENTPLFHITYLIRNDIITKESVQQVLSFVEEGKIKGTRSHDNMTAIITYLVMALRDWQKVDCAVTEYQARHWVKKLKILPDYVHPRDFIYIAMIQRRWWYFLCYPLFYVLTLIIHLNTAMTKYKVRKGVKILKTDTEILYWIRTQLARNYFMISSTKPLIEYFLKKRFGEDYAQGMMEIYYREVDHPNRSKNA